MDFTNPATSASAGSRPSRIRRHVAVGLLTLSVATLAVVAVIVGPLSRAAADLGAAQAETTGAVEIPFLLACDGTAQVEPSSYVLTCADAGAALTGLRWSDWHAHDATGYGVLSALTCDPDCASSATVDYEVRVRADRVEQRGPVGAFSRLRLTFLGQHPAWATGGTADFEVDALTGLRHAP